MNNAQRQQFELEAGRMYGPKVLDNNIYYKNGPMGTQPVSENLQNEVNQFRDQVPNEINWNELGDQVSKIFETNFYNLLQELTRMVISLSPVITRDSLKNILDNLKYLLSYDMSGVPTGNSVNDWDSQLNSPNGVNDRDSRWNNPNGVNDWDSRLDNPNVQYKNEYYYSPNDNTRIERPHPQYSHQNQLL